MDLVGFIIRIYLIHLKIHNELHISAMYFVLKLVTAA